ncbi:MAG: Clp protease N-terminal domain-containing protein, partial [bacterium]|nr:Clp protease N-terminal domain-containing protein [bacterium]
MRNLLNQFTAHLLHVISRAGTFAAEGGARTVEPAHLLLGLALERGSLGCEILAKAHLRPEIVRLALGVGQVGVGQEGTETPSKTPNLSADAKRALEKAALAATTHEHRYIGTEHLLAGLLAIENERIRALFSESHVDVTIIASHLTNVLKSTSKFPEFAETIERQINPETAMAVAGEGDGNAAPQKTPALDFFAKDLTAPAVAMAIDPVIGRETEIERVIQILCRRTKNNPILVGAAGVGKTAIVEGLAKKIVERDVPDILVGKRILALDLALVVAGTIYRGEFESRLKQILDEVRQDKNLVLFIDEIHTIMGAGAASGSLDAANILKPALARGEIRCVGATTYDEY